MVVLELPGVVREDAPMDERLSKRLDFEARIRRQGFARLVCTFAVAAALGSQPGSWSLRADSSPSGFDGAWTGRMQTTYNSGPCGQEYRLEMSIQGGAVTGSASRAGERFTIYGEIGEAGAITWSATSGRGSVDAAGTIEGDAARGEWEDSTGICAGTFSIDRTR